MKMKKYYIYVSKNNEHNDIIIQLKSKMKRHKLRKIIAKMYNVENYDVAIFDIQNSLQYANVKSFFNDVKTKNQCCAKNVFIHEF